MAGSLPEAEYYAHSSTRPPPVSTLTPAPAGAPSHERTWLCVETPRSILASKARRSKSCPTWTVLHAASAEINNTIATREKRNIDPPCNLSGKPAQHGGRTQRQSAQTAQDKPGLPAGRRRWMREQLPRRQGKAERCTRHFYAECGYGDTVDIGELPVMVKTDRAESRPACRLGRPTDEHYPGKPALHRRIAPRERAGRAAHHRHRPEIMDDLGGGVGKVLPVHRYSAVTLMQRSTPVGVWFLLTILAQISCIPRVRGSSVELPFVWRSKATCLPST